MVCWCPRSEIFTPRKYNYCLHSCPKLPERINVACRCAKTSNRHELLDNIVDYRTVWLEEHNRYRELVASGNETRNGITSASNMHAMSYNMELEYMSRCLARNKFVGEEYSCRIMGDGRKVALNIAGDKLRKNTINKTVQMMESW